MKPFVAIDGEAIDNNYCLMCRSDTPEVLRTEFGRLHTAQCLDYLSQIPPKSISVCFGLGYDVNNWIADLTRKQITELWQSNTTYYKDWMLEWVPKRWFAGKHTTGRSFRIYEVFGFFQTSFVKSLESWGLGRSDQIEHMKTQRGSFTRRDTVKIIEYCHEECDLLVELMNKLRESCQGAGIVPDLWMGTGAMATALFKADVDYVHHRYDSDLAEDRPEALNAILSAYFGGRVEQFKQGNFENIKTYDLRSAYPYAISQLTPLYRRKLKHINRPYKPSPDGIYRCRWKNLQGALMPFPVRYKKNIYYPTSGEGWYHGVEVAQALRLGYEIELLEGYKLTRIEGGTQYPFGMVSYRFQQRAELKKKGDAAEKAVKLALNSMYGKMAQGRGFKGKPPKWQSYWWAGQVTAMTRARILQALHEVTDPIMVATDGVFCQGQGTLKPSRDGLGTWEEGSYDRFFCLKSGVYQGIKDGQAITKSRGFFSNEVDYDALRECWEENRSKGVYTYNSHRFLGAGAALARQTLTKWRTWIDDPRIIRMDPEEDLRKRLPYGSDDPEHEYEYLDLLPCDLDITSEAYTPKQSVVTSESLDDIEGFDQPMLREI